MQFLTSLFGGSGNTILTAALALGIVLILIVLGLWLLKVLSRATGNAARGRNRRLSLVDSLPIDQKRQLLIVRRDNVEHLILVGGPADVVIEANIAVDSPAVRAQARRNGALPGDAVGKPPVFSPANPAPLQDPAAQALERLRGPQAAPERKSTSIRHTGLMRPVAAMDKVPIPANADNSGQAASDSARSSAQEAAANGHGGTTTGQAEIGDADTISNLAKGKPADRK